MCAHAVRVAIQKLPGVESVTVSLTRAMTEVRLSPSNKVTLAQLRQIIKDNGFNSGPVDLEAGGTLEERKGRPFLLVSGTEMAFEVAGRSDSPAAFKWIGEQARVKSAQRVLVSGRAEVPDDRLVVSKAEPEPQKK